MRCSRCDTENDVSRRFCKECGAPMATSCPACGTPNEPDAKFCGQCATPLPRPAPELAVSTGADVPGRAASPSTTDSGPLAERRLVSVLFADLVGFTPFAEGRDAEEVRETLSRYFDLARETIERYGGTVEKFIGDAVMAVWGAPTAQEDDAERAVRAALDLVEVVPQLGSGIQARAGVLTGEVAVTLGATNQGMVAGDIVNTAARLQSIAEPGTVVAGEPTFRAAEAAIAFEPIGEASLKGKASPVPAFRALRVVAERGGKYRSGGLEAPFVGRDEELRVLKEALHGTERERKPRLVSVVGPAGIGKTRLAREFERYIDGVMTPVWWQAGRSPAYGDGIAFWPLGEMIRARADLGETDDEATTRTHVAQMLARHVPDEEERRWLEPAVLTLLGVETESPASEQLFAAWRTFFERLTATGTAVLVFEDLQWADGGTLAFIDHLLEWTRDKPLLIVTLARPDLLEHVPSWGARRRQFTSLYLEPLPEPAMRELLRGLVPGLPERAVGAIVARADGVPLYAVETVRMLVSQGRLIQADGAYTPVGDLGEPAIPDSLTALIGARLDALDPADRALMQDASVFGQSFTIAALAAVSGKAEAELEPHLAALVRRELLTLRADPRTADRGQYAFVQGLIGEVAYHMLARRDRKARHLAAARYFESLPTEELAGALATQYLAAQENATEGAEADTLAAQARIALRAAAERASRVGAPEQATAYLEQALSVTEDPAEVAALSEQAGVMASQAGRHEAAERHLRQAVDLLRESGDRLALARAIGERGEALLNAHDLDAALAILEPAAAEFADLADDPGLVMIESQLARDLMLLSRADESIRVADRALEAAERGELRELMADTFVTKGTALTVVGRPAEGLVLLQAGLTIAEQAGDFNTAARARANLAGPMSVDDPRAAFESDRAGLAMAQRLGLRGTAQVSLINAFYNARRLGDWQFLREQVAANLAQDLDPIDRATALGGAAVLMTDLGEPADDVIREMTTLLEGVTDPQSIGQLADVSAFQAFASGRFDEAARIQRAAAPVVDLNAPDAHLFAARSSLLARDLAAARQDLAAFNRTWARGRYTRACKRGIEAGIAALEGRLEESLAAHREALRLLRDLGIEFEVALVGLQMASLLDPSLPEVAAAAAEARETFTRVGAKPYLALLDRALEDHRHVETGSPPPESAAPVPAAATR